MINTEEQSNNASKPSEIVEAPDSVANKSVGEGRRIEELAKELERMADELAGTKTLTILGFVILTFMAATMLVMVATIIIDLVSKHDDQPTIIYTKSI